MTMAGKNDYSKVVYIVLLVLKLVLGKVIVCAFGNVILELRAKSKY